MQINSFYNQFDKLKTKISEDGVYNVISIPNLSHKLGSSIEGFPKFFVNTNVSSSISQNVVREFLSVEYAVPCTILDDEGISQSNNYTIITLRTTEKQLQLYFIEIIVLMLQNIDKYPSQREIAIEVERLITLFSALKLPAKKKIQGLWAELLIIERSRDPELLIDVWHNSPTSKYDFSSGIDKIEVKSTSSEERIHRFSIDQLNPGVHSNLLIASIIVRESGPSSTGLSIRDMYLRICAKVPNTTLQLKIYSVIVETIGADINRMSNVYFDYIGASDSLAFYDYRDIPCIKKEDVPCNVSEVKFTSNLSGLNDVRDSGSSYTYVSSPLFKSLF